MARPEIKSYNSFFHHRCFKKRSDIREEKKARKIRETRNSFEIFTEFPRWRNRGGDRDDNTKELRNVEIFVM